MYCCDVLFSLFFRRAIQNNSSGSTNTLRHSRSGAWSSCEPCGLANINLELALLLQSVQYSMQVAPTLSHLAGGLRMLLPPVDVVWPRALSTNHGYRTTAIPRRSAAASRNAVLQFSMCVARSTDSFFNSLPLFCPPPLTPPCLPFPRFLFPTRPDHRPRAYRHGHHRPGGHRREDDRARRHPQQG